MLHSKSCLTALQRAAMVGLVAAGLIAPAAHAQAPTELIDFVQRLDAAASQEDLSGVMQAYSTALVHGDGLTHEDLEAALVRFWEQYDNLVYETDITRWQDTANGYTSETVTTITGTRELGDQSLMLTATLTAAQEVVNGQIVSQDILDEESSVAAGSNPPELDVNLPEQVDTGEQFYFDAIVLEPLGERLLLGMAIEEEVSSTGYISPLTIEFDLLTSGGLFKEGLAPDSPGQRWLSAIVVRDDGIAGATRRLQITPVE